MANYYASARTNYFAVRDVPAFKAFVAQFPDVTVVSTTVGDRHLDPDRFPHLSPDTPLFALLFNSEVGIPTQVFDSQNDEWDAWDDIDFPGALAEHLAPGWVAELREVGAEKLRYLIGYTIAINSEGQRVEYDLDSIRKAACALGPFYTEPSY